MERLVQRHSLEGLRAVVQRQRRQAHPAAVVMFPADPAHQRGDLAPGGEATEGLERLAPVDDGAEVAPARYIRRRDVQKDALHVVRHAHAHFQDARLGQDSRDSRRQNPHPIRLARQDERHHEDALLPPVILAHDGEGHLDRRQRVVFGPLRVEPHARARVQRLPQARPRLRTAGPPPQPGLHVQGRRRARAVQEVDRQTRRAPRVNAQQRALLGPATRGGLLEDERSAEE